MFMPPITSLPLGLINSCGLHDRLYHLARHLHVDAQGARDSVPAEVEQAAHIDGCTRLGALFRVVLPLALPGYVCTAIFAFINSWNEYMMSFVLMTQSSRWLMSNGLASFIGEFTTPWNTIMAAAFVYTLPPVILFMLLQKYLVQGLTAGAVKG